jgi:3-hydroxyisobutyrate dehydrogenase-like beta-hydroxyacid dehydrogenase
VAGQLNAMAAEQCDASCFRASCDWSKSMCVQQKLNLAQCPLFDATVAGSVREMTNSSLQFVRGGSARQVSGVSLSYVLRFKEVIVSA